MHRMFWPCRSSNYERGSSHPVRRTLLLTPSSVPAGHATLRLARGTSPSKPAQISWSGAAWLTKFFKRDFSSPPALRPPISRTGSSDGSDPRWTVLGDETADRQTTSPFCYVVVGPSTYHDPACVGTNSMIYFGVHACSEVRI